jgi:WD40 repeat protein
MDTLVPILSGGVPALLLLIFNTCRDIGSLQHRILVCTDGLLHIQPYGKGPKVQAFRWDRVRSVRSKTGGMLVVPFSAGGMVQSAQGSTIQACIIDLDDGTSVQLAPFDAPVELYWLIERELARAQRKHRLPGEDAQGGSVPTRAAPLYTYRDHSGDVRAVVWSPDSTRIASASDQTVQLWEVQR